MHPRKEVDYWSLRSYWNLPYNLRDRVCHAYRTEETADHTGYITRRGVPCCGTCERPFFWLVFKCVECDELFIKDFNDPRFCSLDPRCWNCLDRTPYEICTDHCIPIYRTDIGLFPKRPPAGFNPRKFTEEELADAFDF